MRPWSVLMIAAVLLAAAGVAGARDFDPRWAEFAVVVDGDPVPYQMFALYLMPGQDVTIEILDAVDRDHSLFLEGGELVRERPGRWQWTSPDEPGLYRAHALRLDGALVTLNLFVKRPLAEAEDGMLNGYRIGRYPAVGQDGNPIHLPPAGLIEVTEDLAGERISPHFTLGQFLCRQQPDHWPKYLALKPALIQKLELLLEEVNRRGIRTQSFYVMSGYRTPWYNRSIGNVPFSRHVWGAAADIFIDTRGDGRMDDLTGNGRSGFAEARLLSQIVDDLFAEPPSARLVGGLGLYGPRPHRGPFIHIDVRDGPARWDVP